MAPLHTPKRRLPASLALFLSLVFAPVWAMAGTVTGQVTLPRARIPEPAERHRGFVARIKNPVRPVLAFDPREDCFVYLAPKSNGAKAAMPASGKVVWRLDRTTFRQRVLPVLAGTKVELKNVSKKTHPIESPGKKLWTGDPIGPMGKREVTIQKAFDTVRVVSRDAPHIEAWVVPLPTPYFARLDKDGAFKIDNVPAGKYTLKIWYRDGFLSVRKSVTVGSRTTKTKITLPVTLGVKKP